MKIYTKSGDGGKTSLLSGERVPKNHDRVEAYGEVDELNAVIGALAAALPPSIDGTKAQLQAIQADLMHVGAWLAATPGTAVRRQLIPITDDHSLRLEAQIDGMEAELPPLKAFILPGGHLAAAWAHVARTVCRRAERRLVDVAQADLAGSQQDLTAILAYVNRLSDYLFVLARYCNQAAGVAEKIWSQPP